MIYEFICANNHTLELHMSFKEHNKLDKDEKGYYTECRIKYGELGNPYCKEKAYQVFQPTGFVMDGFSKEE